jgi:PAS domain S-box-containing protein
MRKKKLIKDEVVERMRAKTTPLLDLALEYGVSTHTLRTWLRQSQLREQAQEDARRVATSLSQEDYAASSQRERLLIHAFEYSPATIIITDVEGKVVYANPKFVETTGYAIDEVIGQTPRILKSGATTSSEYRQLWKTILSGKEWRGTFKNRRKDGRLYWERASISPVLDADGKISHFMAVKEDITDFIESEQAGRRAAATYSAILATLPCAVLALDAQMTILFANDAAENLLGATLPAGTRIDGLNLQWIDSNGWAMTGADHPLVKLLAGGVERGAQPVCLGIVPPTRGVCWVKISLLPLVLPDAREKALLLTISEDCQRKRQTETSRN